MKMRIISEVTASILVALLFGAAAFIIMGWYLQLQADWLMDSSKVDIQIFTGAVLGIHGFVGRLVYGSKKQKPSQDKPSQRVKKES